MKHILFLFIIIIFCFTTYSQIPAGYYDSAAGLNGIQLKTALHNIIDNHTIIDYSDLHTYYEYTDKKANGKVWDMYSDNPSGTPPYEFSFISADQCGNYSAEGDCYNKEHSWPKSWYGGEIYPMYSDMFVVYPTDGYVNNRRANYPFGEVGSASWTSQNGSKLGTSNYTGYNLTVFEPIDEYKGDFARSYFYMSVRYYGDDFGWPGSDMTIGADFIEWGFNLLYDWHNNDPVSQKEIDRNNAVYQHQNNRNPFIDHPEWVDTIWNPLSINELCLNKIGISPSPTNQTINIKSIYPINKIELYSKTGKLLLLNHYNNNNISINISDFSNGIYFIKIHTAKGILNDKIVVFNN